MKNILMILSVFFSGILFLHAQDAQQLQEADTLFAQGKYAAAIVIYDKIAVKADGNIIGLQAELGVAKCAYYNWDLKKAKRICLEIIATPYEKTDAYASVFFYAYWWLINTYNALEDSGAQKATESELVRFYEANEQLLQDKLYKQMYEKVKKRAGLYR